jgi:trimethylamine--corrinoid protein Co-methyltransferase
MIPRLTEDQIEQIHDGSLRILSRTGVRFYVQEALDLFREGGAEVSDGNLVRVPTDLVEWALDVAPKRIEIYDQTGEPAMTLEGHRSYFGVGSDCMHIYDPITGERRAARLEDVVNGVRLADALPNLDFVMSMFLPSDVPDDEYERRQMVVMLEESTKPIVFVGQDAASTAYAVELAEAVAGGLEHLQERPFIINYVNTVSVFRHNETSVRRLLYAAERNLPTIYGPGNIRGLTAPITRAGALALSNAGLMAGLVLSQLKREGSPFIQTVPRGWTQDMRTMVGLYAPSDGPQGFDIAHHHGLPMFGTGGCSDSKVFDAQAAAEAALTLYTSAAGGANLIHDVGYLDSAMTGCLGLVVLCDEIINWVKSYLQSMEINEETLALDLIEEVGCDGHFLATDHTLRHVRDDWQPALFDRRDYEGWQEDGGTRLEERAREKARDIIRNHRAPRLPEGVSEQLAAIAEG